MAEEKRQGAAETAEMFERRVADVVISGFLTNGLAIGHQLRLFDVLATFDTYQDVDTIASAAKCKPRYIEEWLKMMAVSRVVDIDDEEKKYFLPTHRRATLVSTSCPLAFGLNTSPALTYNHDSLLESFRDTGPCYASPSPRMYELLDSSRQQDWLPFVRGVLLVRACGLEDDLKRGVRFCDVGCAGGALLLLLSGLYPHSSFVGVDIRPEYIEKAKAMAKVDDRRNVEFVVDDITRPSSTPLVTSSGDSEGGGEQFDYAFASLVLHDLDRPEAGAREMLRLLKPGGRALPMELDFEDTVRGNTQIPIAPMFYAYSLYFCLSSAYLSHDHCPLGTLPGKGKLTRILQEAGFSAVELCALGDGTRSLLIVAKK